MKFIIYIMTIIIAIISSATATPITQFGPKMYIQNAQIEYALLFEGAGYRHDLYYEYGNYEGYIATNNWGTGRTKYCNFCSYPSIYGLLNVNDNYSVNNLFRLRLEINNKGKQGAIRSGSSHNNPDGLVHNWFANREGLPLLSDEFNLNISHESFSFNTLTKHYRDNENIKKLLQNENTIFIGFEDIMGGGDRDYNDLILAFNGISSTDNKMRLASVSEPNSMWLILILSVAILSIKRNQGDGNSPV